MNAINNLFRILLYPLLLGLEAISVLLKVIKTLKSFEYTNHKLYFNDSYCLLNPPSSIESK